MSRNERGAAGRTPKKKTDRRIVRTRGRLSDALVALMHEKPFDAITVQEVLDRAQVGRSTFYQHYRDKDDLFVSDVEEFLEHFANSLTTRNEKSDRVAPVEELFAHVGESKHFHRALVESRRIDDFLELARGHFARGIERRLKENPRRNVAGPEQLAATSQAYAGAMLALQRWWIDRGSKPAPKEMDELFHRIVWGDVTR